ncbi:MAG: putative ABC transporter permease [Clostridiales bacterium]|nr:putative ABC transporter permease [Clostridiales bacterium]
MIDLKRIRNTLYIYTVGSFVYSLIEIVFRGHTHWTMVISGGIVFLFLYSIGKLTSDSYYTTQILIFTVFITGVELILGILLNKILKLNVWDYSNRPLNLFGQINLFNSLLWLLLSIPCVIICKRLRERFKEP